MSLQCLFCVLPRTLWITVLILEIPSKLRRKIHFVVVAIDAPETRIRIISLICFSGLLNLLYILNLLIHLSRRNTLVVLGQVGAEKLLLLLNSFKFLLKLFFTVRLVLENKNVGAAILVVVYTDSWCICTRFFEYAWVTLWMAHSGDFGCFWQISFSSSNPVLLIIPAAILYFHLEIIDSLLLAVTLLFNFVINGSLQHSSHIFHVRHANSLNRIRWILCLEAAS